MSVKRVHLAFEGHFVQIPNSWMRDRRLSRRARGLLAELMTHRAGYTLSVAQLVASGPEGRDAIRNTIGELEALGYLRKAQSRQGGRWGEVEYELCDPASTVDGFSGDGEPTVDGFPVDGFSGAGESAPKNTSPSEDQDQEHQGGADAPATPFCSKHPNGTTRRCRACGDARRLFDAALKAPKPIPTPGRRYDPAIYCEHLQLRSGECDACAQDARKALEQQFGGAA